VEKKGGQQKELSANRGCRQPKMRAGGGPKKAFPLGDFSEGEEKASEKSSQLLGRTQKDHHEWKLKLNKQTRGLGERRKRPGKEKIKKKARRDT